MLASNLEEPINTIYRSSNPAFYQKDDKEKSVSKMNGRQAREVFGQDQEITLSCLNNSFLEGKFVEGAKIAAKTANNGQDNCYNIMPVNLGRKFSNIEAKAAAKMGETVAEVKSGFFERLSENANFNFITKFLSKKRENINWTFCKSGKDRTGLVVLDALANNLKETFNIDKQEIITILVKSGHQQDLASHSGSAIGCHGVIRRAADFLPAEYNKDIRNQLAPRSSGFNNSKFNVLKLFAQKIINFINKLFNHSNHSLHSPIDNKTINIFKKSIKKSSKVTVLQSALKYKASNLNSSTNIAPHIVKDNSRNLTIK